LCGVSNWNKMETWKSMSRIVSSHFFVLHLALVGLSNEVASEWTT